MPITQNPRLRLPALLCLGALLLVFALLTPRSTGTAGAQADAGAIHMALQIGFENNVKANTWVVVRVLIENTSAAASQGYLQARFPDSGQYNLSKTALDLPAGARKEVSLLVYAPDYGYDLEVVYYEQNGAGRLDQKALERLTLSTRGSGDTLIGVIASTPSDFNLLSLIKPVSGDAVTVNMGVEDLPAHSLALASLDMLVIAGVDTSSLSKAQVDALASWVQNGGRLVVCGGSAWQKTSAGLRSLLPLDPSGMQETTAWQDLVKTAEVYERSTPAPAEIQALDTPALIATGKLKTGRLGSSQPGGPEVLASAGDVPLVVRQSAGSGEVFFLAFDPQQPPFRTWNGMEDVYRAWFGAPTDTPLWSSGFTDWYNAGNAAQTLPNLTFPPVWLVCGFLLLYMLALGPLNFLLLRRLKRPELAWVTIPGMVLLFSLVILVSGGLTRSQQPILNRLAVVQVWPAEQPFARYDGLVGVYSPGRATYQVKFSGDALPHSLPNQGMSGTDQVQVMQTAAGYKVTDFKVDVSGIASLAVEGSLPAPDIRADVTVEFASTGARLTGSIHNNSGFDLEHAALLTPGGAVAIGNLKAGEVYVLDKLLNETNFTPADAAAGIPIPAAPSFAGKPIALGPVFSTQPSQIEAIMGTADYYSDRLTYRRYCLLMGLMQTSYNAFSGSGYFLTGWSSQAVLPVELEGQKTENQDTTLYIVQLEPATSVAGGEVTVPPSMFSVKTLSSSGVTPSNYGLYLYGGEYFVLEYQVKPAFNFELVNSLTLHLDNPNFSAADAVPVQNVVIELWDYRAQTWVDLSPDLVWGDNKIVQPGRFVSPHGIVRFSLTNSVQNNLTLNSINITLTVAK